jgi:hypothetical protein
MPQASWHRFDSASHAYSLQQRSLSGSHASPDVSQRQIVTPASQ